MNHVLYIRQIVVGSNLTAILTLAISQETANHVGITTFIDINDSTELLKKGQSLKSE